MCVYPGGGWEGMGARDGMEKWWVSVKCGGCAGQNGTRGVVVRSDSRM